MTDENERIYRQLCLILQKIGKTDTPIGPDTNLIEQLELDSMKVLDVVMEIEDELDVSIPLNTLVDVNTVSDLAQLIYEFEKQGR